MQADFHYYATYCAAFLAGYSHSESLEIGRSSQLVDVCSKTFLTKVKGPLNAATTQLQLELMRAPTDPVGLQDITRIWSSFHFLPYDLKADINKGSRYYRYKYRLICNPNGELLKETVNIAKGKGLPAAGLAMHVLADTWAHRYFAGTPSLVINNTNHYFYELLEDGSERKLIFQHNPGDEDDIEKGIYINSVYQGSETSIMNLGHGRAGHLPDYSFIRYKYLPAWGKYEEAIKDNPKEYFLAFTQMVYALKYLKGDLPVFECGVYDTESVGPYEDRIRSIIKKRQLNAEKDWREFGEELSGESIEDFNTDKIEEEYLSAKKRQ